MVRGGRVAFPVSLQNVFDFSTLDTVSNVCRRSSVSCLALKAKKGEGYIIGTGECLNGAPEQRRNSGVRDKPEISMLIGRSRTAGLHSKTSVDQINCSHEAHRDKIAARLY